jgi:hypothetical protein
MDSSSTQIHGIRRKTLPALKDPNKNDSRKRSRTGKTQSAPSTSSKQVTHTEKTASQNILQDSEEEEEESIKVKHETKCYSCDVLSNFTDEQVGQLQHHYKFCSTYSIYFRTITVLKRKIFSDKDWRKNLEIENLKITKDTNVFDIDNAKLICQLASSVLSTSTNITELFTRAAALSEELIGPTETAKFNCDNYKDYLELLLEISQLIGADKVLIEDIELYLKPFQPKHINNAKKDRARKWDETFVDLKHSSGDSNLGYELNNIIPTENTKMNGDETDEEEETISFIPSDYDFECHGYKKSV